MHVLRMLVDVSFFMTFAVLLASPYHTGGAIPAAVLQCLCFGISFAAGNHRSMRLLALLPMLLGWYFCRSSLVDCILLAPTAGYILWLAWKADYGLDWDRQHRLFSLYWKILPIYVPVTAILNPAAAQIIVAYSVIMLTCSVLLMRALRHEPKVYCQKSYQLVNLLMVTAILFLAFLLSSKVFLGACLSALKAAYLYLIYPVLELLLGIILSVLQLFPAFQLPQLEPGNRELNTVGDAAMLEQFGTPNEPNTLLLRVIILILIAAVILLLALFFRWLNKRRNGEYAAAFSGELRSILPSSRKAEDNADASSVRTVRIQYRKFLKLCAVRGILPKESDTSLDVDRQARCDSALGTVSGQIRDIYLRARYAGRTDRDSVQQIKKLCTEAKTNTK